VGADVSVYVTYPKEAQNVSSAILANVSDSIENATIEYSFDASSSSGFRTTVKAVQPQLWLKAAYYEGEWFTGNSAETAFARLSEDKNTVVLERSLASSLNLEVGDHVALSFGSTSRNLLIIGFFGPESAAQQSTFLMPSSSYYWSLVSEELYNELSSTVSAYSARILLKLKTGVNGTNVAESIRSLGLNVSGVDSFAEQWEKKQSDILTVGVLDAQRLGLLFAVLAASVGTALVSFVSMKERSREATIMSVRGLSYKQLVAMFLTENLALVTFAVVLGVSVGFIVIYGNISASNSVQATLIQRRIVFPLDATVTLVSCLTLIFVSTILPILIMSRRYVTKLERMVRLR
jgi:ABC-type antimicrobial peptide transport system permease subunit